jgi:uncharacterized hydrophobic protein (TIGR00271 family)
MEARSTSRPTHLQQWLRIKIHERPKVYEQVYETAEFSSVSYWLEIIFSAGIAVFGLVINSPAVIIGAMLISPLMGPIMASGLALAVGDLYLAIKAIAKLVVSIALAVGLSAFIVWLLPFHSITNEILARINPNLLDLGIAIFSGLAGSVAVCRASGGSGVTTLPGVAIAVALMPPLCTVGYGLGSGANMRIMGGAGLLFLTNLVAITASAFVIFLLVGMNAPEVRAQMALSRKDEVLAHRLERTPLARMVANSGQIHWRILMLLALLAVIAIPLRSAFVQVAQETIARGAVQDVVKTLMPTGDLVSQQVEVSRDAIAVRLIATRNVKADNLRVAEREIERRTGRRVHIVVSSIASQSELADLVQRLTAPPPAPPKPAPETLDEIHAELIQRIQPVVEGVWPAEAPIQTFDLAFNPEGMDIQVSYAARRELDKVSVGLLQSALRDKLAAPTLTLDVKRVPAARKPAAKQPAKGESVVRKPTTPN